LEYDFSVKENRGKGKASREKQLDVREKNKEDVFKSIAEGYKLFYAFWFSTPILSF